MGHGHTMLGLLERFGLTHLSQVAMVAATVCGVALLGLSASQTLLQDTQSIASTPNQAFALPAPDLNQIDAAQLFGTPTVAATSPAELPDTRLQWVLQGVFTGSTPQNGSAIILAGDQNARLFKAQQMLPGGATLSEVHPDHVVLSVAGERETLRFPTITSSSLPTPDKTVANEGTVEVVSLAQENIDSRREIVRQRLEMLRQRAMNRQ